MSRQAPRVNFGLPVRYSDTVNHWFQRVFIASRYTLASRYTVIRYTIYGCYKEIGNNTKLRYVQYDKMAEDARGKRSKAGKYALDALQKQYTLLAAENEEILKESQAAAERAWYSVRNQGQELDFDDPARRRNPCWTYSRKK